MDGRHRATRVIDPGDIDELGHVNNVAWVRFVVELAAAHSESVGLDLPTYREIGGLWVVRRHEVTYRGAAEAGDTVHGATWIESVRGARSIRCAQFDDEAGTRLVDARTEWAFVHAETMRPMRVPAAVMDRFTLVPASETGPGRSTRRR